jgi:putative Holliday junction resolvase
MLGKFQRPVFKRAAKTRRKVSPDMIVSKPEALREIVPKGQRLVGLDIGSKTIGLALSDGLWMVASPMETIRRKKFTPDAEYLLRLLAENQVGGLILGLPLNMDGSEGPRCQSTRQFATNLQNLQDVAIAFWDERLSTAAVQRMMVDEMDLTRKRRSEVVDKLAASYILQGYLDFMRARP